MRRRLNPGIAPRVCAGGRFITANDPSTQPREKRPSAIAQSPLVAPNLFRTETNGGETGDLPGWSQSPLPRAVRNRPRRRGFRSSLAELQTEKDSMAERDGFELPYMDPAPSARSSVEVKGDPEGEQAPVLS